MMVMQVLVEQYRTLPLPVGSGRALALDEAHKFMDGESACTHLIATDFSF